MHSWILHHGEYGQKNVRNVCISMSHNGKSSSIYFIFIHSLSIFWELKYKQIILSFGDKVTKKKKQPNKSLVLLKLYSRSGDNKQGQQQ